MENYTMMNENDSAFEELYEMTKEEAENNAKETEHSKIYGWTSFALGTVMAAFSIMAGLFV